VVENFTIDGIAHWLECQSLASGLSTLHPVYG